ncbi:hypothetical protein [Parapedobacter sp.]
MRKLKERFKDILAVGLLEGSDNRRLCQASTRRPGQEKEIAAGNIVNQSGNMGTLPNRLLHYFCFDIKLKGYEEAHQVSLATDGGFPAIHGSL